MSLKDWNHLAQLSVVGTGIMGESRSVVTGANVLVHASDREEQRVALTEPPTHLFGVLRPERVINSTLLNFLH